MIEMPSSNASETFRQNVRRVMDDRGITISAIAEQVGTPRANMSRILSGQEGVTLDRAERIAMQLQIPLASLLGDKFQTVA